jgi:hypothetical protein
VKSYIIINMPTRTSKDGGPGWVISLAAGFLCGVLPAANPDFDHVYDRVVAFHIELDSDGFPEREVGIDANGQVLAIAPWRKNVGLILDTDGTFDPSKYERISAEQFQREWESFGASSVA